MPPSYILPFAELRLKNFRNLINYHLPGPFFAIEAEFAIASALDIFHRSLHFPIVERREGHLQLVDCAATLNRAEVEVEPEFIDEPHRLILGVGELHDAPTARYMIHVLVSIVHITSWFLLTMPG